MIWHGLAMATALIAACPVEEHRILVSVSWGGGGPHEWFGSLQVEGVGAAVPWSFPQDLEAEDMVLPGPGFTASEYDYRFTRRGLGGEQQEPLSARVAGTTRRDADGLYLLATGDEGVSLRLRGLGEDRDLPLRSLVGQPVVLPVGDAHVVARAFDLDALAPPSRPLPGTRAWRSILHAHSCWSTGQTPFEPQRSSLLPFVRTVWWTDHNPGSQRNILCGDFEDRPLSRWYWRSDQAGGIDVDQQRVVRDPERGRVFALRAQSTGDGPGSLRCRNPGLGVGNIYMGLDLEPRLHFAWRPSPEPGAVGFVLLGLNSGRSLRYLSAALPAMIPGQDLVLPPGPGGWEEHRRDVRADLRALDPGALTDGILEVSFGVILGPGTPQAEWRFDDLRFEVPAPEEWIRRQERSYQGEPRLASHMGMEQSAWDHPQDQGGLTPHLLLLPPRDPAASLKSFHAPPTVEERAATIAAVHAAGGVAGSHHLQIDEAYEFLFEHPTLGLDLFEVGDAWRSMPRYTSAVEQARRDRHGYPDRAADALHPLLARYDAALQRGLLFTLYGAPDLHGVFHGSDEGWFNRWVTSLHAAEDSPEALLRSLRRGQATAMDFQTSAELTLTVDGRPWMGRQVVTDRPEQTVTVHVEGALPGSTLRWVTGALDREVADAEAQEEPDPVTVTREPLVGAATSRTVDTTEACFVRAELLGPSGAIEALTNPVVFLPYWPERFEEGRVAFDVHGVPLEEDAGLWLTGARMEGGRLHLWGQVVAEEGVLRLGGSRPQTHTLPQGALDLELDLGLDGEPASLAVADPVCIPPRKRVDFLLDLSRTDPDAESRLLVGLSAPFDAENGTLAPVRRHEPGFRAVEDRRIEFQLPLPADRECWVVLTSPKDPELAATLRRGSTVLDAVAAHENLVFRIPPTGGAEAVVETRLSVDFAPTPAPMELRIRTIQVLSGPGVVSY